MKSSKKILALLLCAITVVLCFAGCSKAGLAEEITDKTMLIAYTAEKEPFIYKDENGKLTGFDVEVMKKIFDNVKNDYSNYQFVQVEEDYRIGEDAAYTDEDGNEYVAYVMIGGLQKNIGSFNEEHTFTESIIDNRIVTVTAKDSKIATYADMAKAKVGVVTDAAMTALNKNNAIKKACASVKEYESITDALKDLDSGKLTAVVTDEFSFNVLENKDNYAVLNGELDTISYVYAFKKYDWVDEQYNEAIYQLQSPEYNNADEFTPIVEKYFGYDASDFSFVPTKTK
ncbi:MAG: transporter substrate-binding domain-containing protein [Eubacterium sp.]|nr:transporter substrate-binding domain-containing protein [Eubacterium sp.]